MLVGHDVLGAAQYAAEQGGRGAEHDPDDHRVGFAGRSPTPSGQATVIVPAGRFAHEVLDGIGFDWCEVAGEDARLAGEGLWAAVGRDPATGRLSAASPNRNNSGAVLLTPTATALAAVAGRTIRPRRRRERPATPAAVHPVRVRRPAPVGWAARTPATFRAAILLQVTATGRLHLGQVPPVQHLLDDHLDLAR